MSESDTTAVLQPGVLIRPQTTVPDVLKLAERLYGLTDVEIAELISYDDRNYRIKVPAEKRAPDSWPHGFIMKIINSLDSKKLGFFDAQTKMMIYLGEHAILCPQPIKNVSGEYFSIEKIRQKDSGPDAACGEHMVRLLTFQPGTILHQVPCSNHLFYHAGRYVARLDNILKGFHHEAFATHKSLWHLEAVPQLRKFMFAVTDVDRLALVTRVLEEFDALVIPAMGNLERGVIHGDFNEQNILVRKTAPAASGEAAIEGSEWEIHAVIDFGDTQESCLLFELAIAACYMMLQCRDGNPLDVPGHVIAGYTIEHPLPAHEIALLKTCLVGRLCQSVVMGAYSYLQDPGNDYILTTQAAGWALLAKLDAEPSDALAARWANIVSSYLKH